MIGKPRFKESDRVSFVIENELVEGIIYIVDEYGTFEQSEEPSYDVLAEFKGTKCLVKHISESGLTLL